MNKKGISAIVATVLKVLLVVVGTSIIWVGFLSMVSDDVDINKDTRLNIISSEGYTLWDEEHSLVTVQIEKKGEGEICGLDLIFVIDGDSVTHRENVTPEINNKKVYYVNLSGYGRELSKISVAPVFCDGMVGVVTGELKDISKGDIQKLIDNSDLDVTFEEPNGGYIGEGGDDNLVEDEEDEEIGIECPEEAICYYIDTIRGNNNNDGSTDYPFITLIQAKNNVRDLRNNEGFNGQVYIYLRGGTYEIDETFTLDSSDSGYSAVSTTTYSSYPGEQAIISGGKLLANSAVEEITDSSISNRLNASIRNNVKQINLAEQGITDFGEFIVRGYRGSKVNAHLELFIDDEPMTVARWPNNEYLNIERLPNGEDTASESEIPEGFYYNTSRYGNWETLSNVWAHGYWMYPWAETHQPVDSIDLETGLIKIHDATYGLSVGGRFYFQNVLEELDSPGEYYVDNNIGMLYFYPPADYSEIKVSLLEDEIVTIEGGCGFVILKDLLFENARGGAVSIWGSNNQIKNTTIRNVGKYGIYIYANETSIVGNEIFNTGAGGIDVGQRVAGSRITLTSSNNVISDNVIHDYARWVRTYTPAVNLYGVGFEVSHNLIYNAPHQAIAIQGNDHVIEFNEIHDVVLETADSSAIYSWGDLTYRGNVIDNNFIYNLHNNEHIPQEGPNHVQGVYIDGMTSGFDVRNNIFYNVSRMFLINGGRDNLIENNLVIDFELSSVALGDGIDSNGVSHLDYLMKRLIGEYRMPYDTPPWSTRYPRLANILEGPYNGDDIYKNALFPLGNVLKNNVGNQVVWLDLRNEVRDNESYYNLSGNAFWWGFKVIDAENHNFNMTQEMIDGIATVSDFQQIDISTVGPRI